MKNKKRFILVSFLFSVFFIFSIQGVSADCYYRAPFGPLGEIGDLTNCPALSCSSSSNILPDKIYGWCSRTKTTNCDCTTGNGCGQVCTTTDFYYPDSYNNPDFKQTTGWSCPENQEAKCTFCGECGTRNSEGKCVSNDPAGDNNCFYCFCDETQNPNCKKIVDMAGNVGECRKCDYLGNIVNCQNCDSQGNCAEATNPDVTYNCPSLARYDLNNDGTCEGDSCQDIHEGAEACICKKLCQCQTVDNARIWKVISQTCPEEKLCPKECSGKKEGDEIVINNLPYFCVWDAMIKCLIAQVKKEGGCEEGEFDGGSLELRGFWNGPVAKIKDPVLGTVIRWPPNLPIDMGFDSSVVNKLFEMNSNENERCQTIKDWVNNKKNNALNNFWNNVENDKNDLYSKIGIDKFKYNIKGNMKVHITMSFSWYDMLGGGDKVMLPGYIKAFEDYQKNLDSGKDGIFSFIKNILGKVGNKDDATSTGYFNQDRWAKFDILANSESFNSGVKVVVTYNGQRTYKKGLLRRLVREEVSETKEIDYNFEDFSKIIVGIISAGLPDTEQKYQEECAYISKEEQEKQEKDPTYKPKKTYTKYSSEKCPTENGEIEAIYCYGVGIDTPEGTIPIRALKKIIIKSNDKTEIVTWQYNKGILIYDGFKWTIINMDVDKLIKDFDPKNGNLLKCKDQKPSKIQEQQTSCIKGGNIWDPIKQVCNLKPSVTSPKCFFSRVIYLEEQDEKKLQTLREYRDKVLSKSLTGRAIINFHYSEAGEITGKVVEKIPFAKKVIRKYLDFVVERYGGNN